MECLVIKMHVIVLVNMHFMNTIRMQRNKRSYWSGSFGSHLCNRPL